MTFRSKPAGKRVHRAPHDADHRRNVLLTIGFGLVVLLALLILGGAVAASYYGDHFASLATVNGSGISKDDLRDRYIVDTFRLDYKEARIRAREDAGRIDSATAQSQVSAIAQERESAVTTAVENLIDATLQAQLGATLGVTVSDQQVADQVEADATQPEARHTWIIGVRPKAAEGATEITDADKAAAKAKAEAALAELKAGKAWEVVSRAYPDDVYSSKAGEVGWISRTGNFLDDSIIEPIFALAAGGMTDVIEGEDGEFRIVRVTEIDAETIDQAYEVKIRDAGVSMDSYRRAARADAMQKAIESKLIADTVEQPSLQRQISEIFIATTNAGNEGQGDEVKVRHILFSPNDDPNGAAGLPATDPAWKKAEDEAIAEYNILIADPSRFQEDARTRSDDEGTAPGGGDLPYYTKVNLDQAFANAVFVDGLVKDQILAPVKSGFGWHVIQFLDRRKKPIDRMKDIQALASQPGADFATLARTHSEDPSKDNGGDIGWVAKYQFNSIREIAIFKAPVGGLTEVIQDVGGIYLFKIVAEQMRVADPDQAAIVRANAFSNWYTAEKAQARITREYSTNNEQLPVVQ